MPISEVYNEDNMIGMARYPDGFFELAIVDPPYGNETRADVGTGEYSRNILKNRNGGWDMRPTDQYFTELFRVSKNQIIWGGNFFNLPPHRGWICWYKTDEMKGRDFSEIELAYTSFDRPARMYSCKPFIRNGQRIHPTQKPLQLYKYLLLNYCNSGDKILDTHMGSQSSRIAAFNMGFDYYGWEIDKEYFHAGNKRFKEQTKQLHLL